MFSPIRRLNAAPMSCRIERPMRDEQMPGPLPRALPSFERYQLLYRRGGAFAPLFWLFCRLVMRSGRFAGGDPSSRSRATFSGRVRNKRDMYFAFTPTARGRRAALYESLSKSRDLATAVLGSHTHDPEESDRIGQRPWWARPRRVLSQIGRPTCQTVNISFTRGAFPDWSVRCS